METHDEIETISEKLVYRKFIKDSDFETSKVFEWENIEERKNIKYYPQWRRQSG